jgi:hypothetical protein
MSATKFPSSVAELARRLAGSPGATSDDQSRSADGEALDSREAVERFLADVERSRPTGDA